MTIKPEVWRHLTAAVLTILATYVTFELIPGFYGHRWGDARLPGAAEKIPRRGG